jgi:acetyltransferase-like isoleucine patch superfamily enzyme
MGNGHPYYIFESDLLRDMDTPLFNLVKAINDPDCFPSKRKELICRAFSSTPESVLNTVKIGKNFDGLGLFMVRLEPNVTIGNGNFWIAQGGVCVGRDTWIGDQVSIVTITHGMHPTQRKLQIPGEVVIGNNVLVGGQTTIFNPIKGEPGFVEPLTIGDGAVVMPNSFVNQSIPEGEIWGGVPARKLSNQKRLEISEFIQQSPSARSFPPCAIKTQEDQLLMDLYNTQNPEKVRELMVKIFSSMNSEDVALFNVAPTFWGKRLDRVSVGGGTYLNRGVYISAEGDSVKLGRDCETAFGSQIVSLPGAGPIEIGNDVWIASNAKIENCSPEPLIVGEGSVIAAYATLNKSVPPHSIVRGESDVVKGRTTLQSAYEGLPSEWMDVQNYFPPLIRKWVDAMTSTPVNLKQVSRTRDDQNNSCI